MKPSDAALLLTSIAPFTRREPAETDAIAWAAALDPEITVQDAIEAGAQHYRESDAWIMPSHINQRVRTIQRERIRADGSAPIPGGLTYAQEQAWRLPYHAAIRAGASRAEAITAANAATGYTPPAEIDRPVQQAIETQVQRWTTTSARAHAINTEGAKR